MAKPRQINEIQQDLSQQVYGLGEIEYNYSQYDKNRERLIGKILEFQKELETSHKFYSAEAVKKHEEALANGNGKDKNPPGTEATKAPDLQ
jgi:hypothetical protein